MIDTPPAPIAVVAEHDLRRQIDRSVSRALVDSDYAQLLLADPTVVLEDRGCAPQQYRTLRSIQASDLLDFAQQAHSLFWAVEPVRTSMPQEDQRPLAAAAR